MPLGINTINRITGPSRAPFLLLPSPKIYKVKRSKGKGQRKSAFKGGPGPAGDSVLSLFLSCYMWPEGPWQQLRCCRSVSCIAFTYNLIMSQTGIAGHSRAPPWRWGGIAVDQGVEFGIAASLQSHTTCELRFGWGFLLATGKDLIRTRTSGWPFSGCGA